MSAQGVWRHRGLPSSPGDLPAIQQFGATPRQSLHFPDPKHEAHNWVPDLVADAGALKPFGGRMNFVPRQAGQRPVPRHVLQISCPTTKYLRALGALIVDAFNHRMITEQSRGKDCRGSKTALGMPSSTGCIGCGENGHPLT
jgi:hypothetical protein